MFCNLDLNKRQQAFWHHHHRAINKVSGAVVGETPTSTIFSPVNSAPSALGSI
jgi:hypothetical protein